MQVLLCVCAFIYSSVLVDAYPAAYKQHGRPHVVVFFVDDLGWNDVGFHGMTQIPTPNIDSLASDGIILNSYYTAPMCTPSRASLMSGYYPSTTGNQHDVIVPSQACGLPLNFRTLPEHMRNLGYTNHMVGKWHLGHFRKEYTPLYRGFDSHYGFLGGATDHFFHTFSTPKIPRKKLIHIPYYEKNEKIVLSGLDFRDNFQTVTDKVGNYLADLYTERAVRRIHEHDSSQPLFLYLSHHGVHRGSMEEPIRAPLKYIRDLNYIVDVDRRNFAGSVRAIDFSLGEIMEALEQKNMLNNTIVIFLSDNGAAKPGTYFGSRGSNFPLRGAKLSGFEGGSRVPAYVWGHTLPKSKIFDGLMHISDWLPTLYEAAGGNPKDLGPLDGMSMWNALHGRGHSPRVDVLHLSEPIFNMTSYRYGDYKVVSGSYPLEHIDDYYGDDGLQVAPRELSSARSKVQSVLRRLYKGEQDKRYALRIQIHCGQKPKDNTCDLKKEICLFNIRDDPCEYKNLAKTHPQILKDILAKYEVVKKRVVYPWAPPHDYRSNPVYHGGYWSPWLDEPLRHADHL